MTLKAEQIPKTLLLASLYRRLGDVEPLVRIVLSEAELSALLTFRGDPERKVLLDYTKRPARIVINGAETAAKIYVKIDAEIMHEVLTGVITPGIAIARRQLLLRGSPGHLARFIPLLDFGGMMYCEHLSDVGYGEYARAPGAAAIKETEMTEILFNGDPIPLVKLNPLEKALFGVINISAFLLGYTVGFLRYRILKKLSLFDILRSMSKGLEKAAPENTAGG